MEKLQRSNKMAAKQAKAQLREIAQLLSFCHLHSDPLDTVACVHRDDGDVEFMNILANQLSPQVLGAVHVILSGCGYPCVSCIGSVCDGDSRWRQGMWSVPFGWQR